MTVKQHINHGAIQKVCRLHNGTFYSINRVTLSLFFSITSLDLFNENKKLWNESPLPLPPTSVYGPECNYPRVWGKMCLIKKDPSYNKEKKLDNHF